jgi:hypothetical protein
MPDMVHLPRVTSSPLDSVAGERIGYAHSVNRQPKLHADHMTLGSRSETRIESGTATCKPQLSRITLCAGIGSGHKPVNTGWKSHSYLGRGLVASFTVTETRGSALVNGSALGDTQVDMDKEPPDVRDGVAELKILPQLGSTLV